MFHLLADSASFVPDLPPIVNDILQYGVLGIIVFLFITGYIISKPYLDHVKSEGRAWKEAYEEEREAHDETRDALSISVKSNESTQEQARTLTSILREAGHRETAHEDL